MIIEKAWQDAPRCEMCGYPMTLEECCADGMDDDFIDIEDPVDLVLVCISCPWREYRQREIERAQKVQSAYGRRMQTLREAFQQKLARDREQARQLFERAGKPLPAWLAAELAAESRRHYELTHLTKEECE